MGAFAPSKHEVPFYMYDKSCVYTMIVLSFSLYKKQLLKLKTVRGPR